MTFKPTEFIFRPPSEDELNELIAEVWTTEFPGEPITAERAALVREVILGELMTEQTIAAIEACL